jgi:hypothetical protein
MMSRYSFLHCSTLQAEDSTGGSSDVKVDVLYVLDIMETLPCTIINALMYLCLFI